MRIILWKIECLYNEWRHRWWFLHLNWCNRFIFEPEESMFWKGLMDYYDEDLF